MEGPEINTGSKKPIVVKTISSAPVKYTPQQSQYKSTSSWNEQQALHSLPLQLDIKKATATGTSYQEALKAVDGKATQPTYVFPHNAPKRSDNGLGTYNPRYFRKAAEEQWEDPTLGDWDTEDYRIFVGDLGNEVNDDMLAKAFNKYPTFQRARVLRDKRSGKTKGFGFVSFRDPSDFARAVKEVNGKYIGNRPCKIKKSRWKDRLDDERVDKDKKWQLTHKKPVI